MKPRTAAAACALLLVPALAAGWMGAPPPPPSGTLPFDPGTGSIYIWPYTGTSFSGDPSDPVNLFFPDADPRAIRQALLKLEGETRPPLGNPAPPFNDCTWIDAMGYEQTSWAETEGWVGSEIQLVCVHPKAPFGDPFRVHLRLFRQGPHTFGGAHFEFLIPGSAEHEVLSWDFAQLFVQLDMARTGRLTAAPEAIPVLGPGYFRAVRRPVYNALVAAGAGGLLASLQLFPPDDPVTGTADVPIPTAGTVLVLEAELPLEHRPERTRTHLVIQYDIVAPKPFCGGPYDYVRLKGAVRFGLEVNVDHAGRFTRAYSVDGNLKATPTNPLTGEPVGEPARAKVWERHFAYLTKHHGQVYEALSQVLESDPEQSRRWLLKVGEYDRYWIDVSCGY